MVVALLMICVTKFTPSVTLSFLGEMYCKDGMPTDGPNSYY
jgi:hypothetical protein